MPADGHTRRGALLASPPQARPLPMPTLEDLVDRIERLLLRHEEIKRTNALLEQQLGAVVAERDHLRARLTAARGRIDALIERLPADDNSNSGNQRNPA